MTRFDFAPDLIEEAVFEAMQRERCAGTVQAREWDRDREAVYALPSLERDAAFLSLAARAFRALRLDGEIERAVAWFPELSSRLDLLHVRRVRRERDEGAELYVRGLAATDGTRAVLGLRTQRFADHPGLFDFACSELAHLDDMLSPSFAYRPELPRELEEPERERLRERLHELWRVRSRSRSRSRAPAPLPDARFRATFGPEADALLGSIWTGEIATYDGLIDAALHRGLIAHE